MTPLNLEAYLHAHIPLSAAMQVHVEEVTDEHVRLSAPLAPNINHRETVFGGSASALSILSAWSLLHVRLTRAGVPARLVIQSNRMEYLKPVAGPFAACATLADIGQWPDFLRVFHRRGKARIVVAAELLDGDELAGRFEGEFVALGHGKS
ncbi:thioesterase domain-containing protein [Ensifer adhaerens]|uniref:Thioesterase domain-containing protein n=1 Tax=Ensifer adhaerens TaxID=106592 RepID=A0ACC5SZ41_ENSAD|nr:thioesterase domain-containing protein [Ensifer adhaerens]MBP1874156.1 thioesterase domain-containing protein [Ensifer adhaerens]